MTLSGCASGKWGFPYKAPIQQGNWITSEQVALLQPGMTREQVRFALGSPTLTSVLHADRWDYPYYFKPGYGDAVERKFTVYFQNDVLARWEGDQQPALQPFQMGQQNPKADERAEERSARETERIREDAGRQVTPRINVDAVTGDGSGNPSTVPASVGGPSPALP
ncbi:outer membrane protein assembly factor BamE [Achromobacter sp. KS-M25]|nr:outer membrane protein assembly factor BamE [Achromobacter aestuarii]